MRTLVDSVLSELRAISHGLRPPALDRLGLPGALRDLAGSASGPGLSVHVSVAPEQFPPLPPDVAAAGFRIAQAALANVVTHARARNVWFTLQADNGSIDLSVEDDGVGFDVAATHLTGGLGLIGMRERAAWLGGTLELDTAVGRGTRLRVSLPVA